MDETTFATLVLTMMARECVWEGTYRHINVDGNLHDEHQARVTCEFPISGSYPYIQHYLFT